MRAGTLIVDIAANLARLVQDMEQAKSVVANAMKDVDHSVGVAKKAFAGLGVTLSVGYFAGMIRETIEAQSRLLELAQRTGSTVEALSSLQGAARRSSTDMADVGTALQKLSKSMAEVGNGTSNAGKVFKTLEISVRDANGALKPAQDLLQELGSKLVGMKSQTLAVAFAQEVLGKSGANMLAFFHQLAEEGKLVPKVFTDQAEAADRFGDNLDRLAERGEDLKRSFANSLLPALNDIAQAMVDARKAGDSLFATLGAGFAAALTPSERIRAQGDIAALSKRRGELQGRLDMATTVQRNNRVGGFVRDLFGASAEDVRAQVEPELAQIDARLKARYAQLQQLDEDAARVGRPKASGGTDPANPLGKAEKDTEFQSLMKGITERTAALKAELAATEPLTESQKKLAGLLEAVAKGYVKLDDVKLQLARTALLEQGTLEHEIQLRKIAAESAEGHAKAIAEMYQAQQKALDANRDEIKKLQEHNAEIGKTKAQIEALEAARVDDTIAIKERNLALQESDGVETSYLEVLRKEIDQLREIRDLRSRGSVLTGVAEAAKKQAEEQKRMNEQIEQSLSAAVTDGLMHGFRKGESFAKNFINRLEELFKTAVLEPIIQPIVKSGANFISGMMGGGGGGFPSAGSFMNFMGGGGGGGGMGGQVLGALGVGGGGATMGTLMADSIMAEMVGGAAVGASGAAAGGMAMAGAMSAVPYVGLAVAALSMMGAFDEGGGPKGSSIKMFRGADGLFGLDVGDISDAGSSQADFAAGPAASLTAALNDPRQYNAGILASMVGEYSLGGPSDSASALAFLTQKIAPAIFDAAKEQADAAKSTQEAAAQLKRVSDQVDQVSGQLRAMVDQLPEQLGLTSIQGGIDRMSVSSDLAPLERLSGARGLYSSMFARAMTGDVESVKGLPGAAEQLLGIGRDVYASGPQYQAIRDDVSRAYAEVYSHQDAVRNDIMSTVPATVLQIGSDIVTGIRRQTADLVAQLQSLEQEVRTLREQATV